MLDLPKIPAAMRWDVENKRKPSRCHDALEKYFRVPSSEKSRDEPAGITHMGDAERGKAAHTAFARGVMGETRRQHIDHGLGRSSRSCP
jgi:hypothetical protein